jgi:hypothetical protein
MSLRRFANALADSVAGRERAVEPSDTDPPESGREVSTEARGSQSGWMRMREAASGGGLGARRNRRILLAAAVMCLALACAPFGASSGAAQPPESPLGVTLPNHWISGWGHGTVGCRDVTSLPWAFWKTYGEARIGDRWLVYTSRRSLCNVASKQARSIIKRQPSHLGATLDRAQQEIYATASSLNSDGTPKRLTPFDPPGYRCYILPPSLEIGFEQEDKLFNNSETAWTQAVGVSASYVICLTKPHLRGKKFTSGSYFAFGPRASACALT